MKRSPIFVLVVVYLAGGATAAVLISMSHGRSDTRPYVENAPFPQDSRLDRRSLATSAATAQVVSPPGEPADDAPQGGETSRPMLAADERSCSFSDESVKVDRDLRFLMAIDDEEVTQIGIEVRRRVRYCLDSLLATSWEDLLGPERPRRFDSTASGRHFEESFEGSVQACFFQLFLCLRKNRTHDEIRALYDLVAREFHDVWLAETHTRVARQSTGPVHQERECAAMRCERELRSARRVMFDRVRPQLTEEECRVIFEDHVGEFGYDDPRVLLPRDWDGFFMGSTPRPDDEELIDEFAWVCASLRRERSPAELRLMFSDFAEGYMGWRRGNEPHENAYLRLRPMLGDEEWAVLRSAARRLSLVLVK